MFKLIGHIDEYYKDTVSTSGIEFDLTWLWNKLVDYGNYWDLHTPTVNGNPDYMFLKGWIEGFCASKGYELAESDDKIEVYKRNRLILVMKINPKPKSYFDTKKEIDEMLNSLYGS